MKSLKQYMEITPVLPVARQLWYFIGSLELFMVFQNCYVFVQAFLMEHWLGNTGLELEWMLQRSAPCIE
jgi:hypothetical protein